MALALVTSWVRALLEYVGLREPRVPVLFLGLDNAGKSTLLHMLITDRIAVMPPTVHPAEHGMELAGVECTVTELGGSLGDRTWGPYYEAAAGVVYMVDASDVHRVQESRDVLRRVRAAPRLAHKPILILCNKADMRQALGEGALRAGLALPLLAAADQTLAGPVHLCMCSVVRRQGYQEGLEWIMREVVART